jgi:hypothetical protein
MMIARVINDMNTGVLLEGASFGQQYILQQGIKMWRDVGSQAAIKEADQLPKQNFFSPIHVADLSPLEWCKVQEALMFFSEKRDKTIKGQLVYNRKPTRA